MRSTLDITPRTPAPPAARGAVSNADRTPPGVSSLLARAGQPDYFGWLEHVRSAAGCTRPVRLAGDLFTVQSSTGRIVEHRHTNDLPDATIYKACGTRRARLCPSCARTYQADAYQLIRAGLIGGKGVPATVAGHGTLFGTFTAPSFGTVHTRYVKTCACGNPRRCSCRPEPCHARRDPAICPHGVQIACFDRHDDTDPIVGTPLCADCYDYDHHAIWNNHAGLLWRRTKEIAERQLAKLCRARRIPFVPKVSNSGRVTYKPPARIAHGKVAEFQRRGVVHFHAILRLDGVDPHDPAAVIPPPDGISIEDLVDVLTHAVHTAQLRTAAHPDHPRGWLINWGDPDKALDLRPVTLHGDGSITDGQVAGYLAKYATKATEDAGHSSTRLTDDTVDLYANPEGSHTERLIDACWHLGRPAATGFDGLRRWAHMLGYGGHFLTKARRYSTTFAVLRAVRVDFRRAETTQASTSGPLATAVDVDEDQALAVAALRFASSGWHTTADAFLANTAADMARRRAQAARDELAHEIGTALNNAQSHA
ncbi:replication initiator [Pilimelia columellifera]|uniref:Replication initiator protein RepSA n=1 Tax=Pilimelia columellifera subsp. columellifera TaxID=706583 RepID=A0ABN3MXP5_9ACTN